MSSSPSFHMMRVLKENGAFIPEPLLLVGGHQLTIQESSLHKLSGTKFWIAISNIDDRRSGSGKVNSIIHLSIKRADTVPERLA